MAIHHVAKNTGNAFNSIQKNPQKTTGPISKPNTLMMAAQI